MNYFSLFPIIDYNGHRTRNLTLSVKINEILNGANFYYYTLRDKDRPDSVANDYYGDSTLAWLVLMSNKIVDPYHEWPLSQNDFESFIKEKYGTTEIATSTVKHWRKKNEVLYFLSADPSIIIDSIEYGSESDKTKWQALDYNEDIVIEQESYDFRDDKAEFESVTAYDYEFELNEEKRTIRILNRQHVTHTISSIRELLNA